MCNSTRFRLEHDGGRTFSQKPWIHFWIERAFIGEITVFFRIPRNKTKHLSNSFLVYIQADCTLYMLVTYMVYWYMSLIKPQQHFQTLKNLLQFINLRQLLQWISSLSSLMPASRTPSYSGIVCISHTESSSPPNKPAPSFIPLPFLRHQAPFLEGFCGPKSSWITPALWSHSHQDYFRIVKVCNL